MKIEGLEKGSVDRGSPMAKDRFLLAYQKGVDLASRTVEVIASTIQIDRDGEVILPSAFKKTLGPFLASHAPLISQHTHRTQDGSPAQAGWVVDGKVERQRVPMSIRFCESDPADSCERWWRRAAAPKGKGIAVSIGFIPIRWVYGATADLVREFPELKEIFAEAGLRDDDKLRVYSEIELYELSIVGVPSNRGAQQILSVLKGLGLETDPDAAAPPPDGKAVADLAALFASKVNEAVVEGLKSAIDNLRSEIRGYREVVEAALPGVDGDDGGGDDGPVDPDPPSRGSGPGTDEDVQEAARALRAALDTNPNP